jgi:hypothetical protein
MALGGTAVRQTADADELIDEADELGRRFVDFESQPSPVQLVAVFPLLLSVLGSIKCRQARENISRETVADAVRRAANSTRAARR